MDFNAEVSGLVHISELRRGLGARRQQQQHHQVPGPGQGLGRGGKDGGFSGGSSSHGHAQHQGRHQHWQQQQAADAHDLAAVGDLLRLRVVSIDLLRKRVALALAM